MRVAFLILLAVNVLIFVWGQGYLGQQNAGREPGHLAQQLAPDKVSIVSPASLKKAASPPAAE